MANGYVDLGTYVGFTPYVGAGLGVLYFRSKMNVGATCEGSDVSQVGTLGDVTTTTNTVFECRNQGSDGTAQYETASYDQSEYNLMYALSAGVSLSDDKEYLPRHRLFFSSMVSPRHGQIYYTVSENGLSESKGMDMHPGQGRPALRSLVGSDAHGFMAAGFGPPFAFAPCPGLRVFGNDKTFLLTPGGERNIAVRGPPLPNEGPTIWKDRPR